MKSWGLAIASGVAIALVLFGPLWRAGFVYDDRWRVVQNPAIRSIQPLLFVLDRESVANPRSGLSTDIYNPLTTLSFAVDYHFFHLRPAAYHLENMGWHVLNALLFGAIVFALGKNPWVAYVSALIFLIHPVQLQSVAWISQRSTVLSAFAELVALAAFLGMAGRSFTVLGIGMISYALALGAKESAVTFGFLYAVVSWWRFRHASSAQYLKRREVALVAILLLMAFLFLVWRAHVLGQWSQAADRTVTSEWMLGFLAWPVYLGKVLAPMALRPSYLYPVVAPSIVLIALASWLGYGMVWAANVKRRPVVAASLAWGGLALLPALHVLPLRTFVGERFLYLPMMGFSVFFACVAQGSRLRRWLLYGWLLFLGVTTARLVPTWHDESAFWSAAIRVDPRNAFAQACYADTRRDPHEAIDRYRVVLSLPATVEIRFSAEVNVAHLLLAVGQNREALSYSQMALIDHPTDLNALFDECLALDRTGRKDQARRMYRTLRDQPQVPAGFIQALGSELDRGSEK